MKTLSTFTLGLLLLVSGMALTTSTWADSPKKGPGYGMHHHGKAWMEDLSDKQRQQVDKLHLEYKKKKYLLKSQIKQAKVELALLITSDSPNQSDIDKKIDQILKLKGEKMRQMADHKIKIRKVLNEEQRVRFDLHVLKKAYKGKRYKHKH